MQPVNFGYTPSHLPSTQLPRQPLQFGRTQQALLEDYDKTLEGLSGIYPDSLANGAAKIHEKVAHEVAHPPQEFTLNNGTVWYFNSSTNGLLDRGAEGAGAGKPPGVFNKDMQHLDHFMIHGPNQATLTLKTSREDTDPRTGKPVLHYRYTVKGHPQLQLTRKQRFDAQGQLHEQFTFHNGSDKAAVFEVDMGSSARDIFQARSPGAQSIATDVQYQAIQYSDNSIDLKATHGVPDQSVPTNSIYTVLRPTGQYQSFKPVDKTTTKLRIEVPAGETVQSGVIMGFYNELRGGVETMPPALQQLNQSLNPKLKVNGRRRMDHLPQMLKTSMQDMNQLTIPVNVGKTRFYVPAAGMPNYMAVFGRDSLIASMQALDFNPLLARDTLAVLAHYQYQDKTPDPKREAEFGKILHELRLGEATRLGLTPHTPYYGTIDATPLFVVLFEKYLQRTSDAALKEALWPNFEAALTWLDANIVDDENSELYGFLVQKSGVQDDTGATGLENQSWKDSGDSFDVVALKDISWGKTYYRNHEGLIRDERNNVLVDRQGNLTRTGKMRNLELVGPNQPMAVAEVQAYAYGAWQAAARLYEARGDHQQADEYRQKAADLKQRFNEKFWMPEDNFIAMAYLADGNPLRAVSSNGAQALMTGIVDPDKAERMVQRLKAEDMSSGWGIRTLSSNSVGYDPLSYHRGSIWPHDNSLIINGIAEQYGMKEEAAALAEQLLLAGRRFKDGRYPELYSGQAKGKHDRTILSYPETCEKQAWAAGTTPLILSSLLGLRVDDKKRIINLNNPTLPRGVNEMELTLKLAPHTLFDPGNPFRSAPTIEALGTRMHQQAEPPANSQAQSQNSVTLQLAKRADGSVKVSRKDGAHDITVRAVNTVSPSSVKKAG